MAIGKSIDPIDELLGQRLRAARIERGLSQTELGRAVGVSFQQIQKYEKGTNRISANMLARISYQLQMPIAYFYKELLSDNLNYAT